jgi:hypothetical protein
MNKQLVRISFILGLIFIGSGVSSCDKEYPKMEVVKDCTGTYLRNKAGQDFYVCNFAILDSYATGDKIRVKYDNLNECFGLIEEPTCELLHIHEGVIDVLDIKD